MDTILLVAQRAPLAIRWEMRHRVGKILVMRVVRIADTAARPRQTQCGRSINMHATTPLEGVVDAALAGSARASKLVGSKVYQRDAPIGQIEDVLVEFDSATVTAVILSVDGFLGIGEKLVAVPVNQIMVGTEARFITDLTKDQLTSAPAFDFGKLKQAS